MFLHRHQIILGVVALGCVTILLGSNRYGFTLSDTTWTSMETNYLLVQQHRLQWQQKTMDKSVNTSFDKLHRDQYSTVTTTTGSVVSVWPRRSNNSLEEPQGGNLKLTSMQNVQEKEEHDEQSGQFETILVMLQNHTLPNEHKDVTTTERSPVVILPRLSVKRHRPKVISGEPVINMSYMYQQPARTNTTELRDEGTNSFHRPSQHPVPNESSTTPPRVTEAIPMDSTALESAQSQSEHREKLLKMLKTVFPSQLRKYGKKFPTKYANRLPNTNNGSQPTPILTPTLQSILAMTVNLTASQDASTDTQTHLPDVFFSVKAAKPLHSTRLSLLLVTWMQNVHPQQVHIVTDTYDDEWTQTARKLGFNIIHSRCEHEHSVLGLCCKTNVEFQQYYAAVKKGGAFRWYCHFDDDTYVNILALSKTLRRYQPDVEPLYIGHFPSVRRELGKVSPTHLKKFFPNHKGSRQFYFATGAAYCLSSTLMTELAQYLRRFEAVCRNKLSLPDDMAVSALVCTVLGHKLTEIPEMTSHLEPVGLIPQEFLQDMVSVGFKGTTTVKITNGRFTTEEDPSRFISYHCLLHPETKWCQRPLTA